MSDRLLVASPAYYRTLEDQWEWSGRMQETARRVGLDVLVYGLGRQIDCHNTNAQSWDLIELLEGRTEKYVLVCDCVDVAFLAGEEEIVEKFESFNSGMVVSAEKDAISGMARTGGELGKYRGYFTNLNIGLWMGERKYAMHCLSESMRLYRHNPETKECWPDSPQAWMGYMLAWGGRDPASVPEDIRHLCCDGAAVPKFELDRDCVLFQSMNLGTNGGDVTVQGKRVVNWATGTRPVALHYNGDKSYVAYREMVGRLLA